MGRKSLLDVRQEEIIREFYEVAKEVGLENASVGKVADRMDISKGLVMHYFSTKESLLLALNDHILDQYLTFINAQRNETVQNEEELMAFVASLFTRKWGDYVDDSVFYSFYALIYRHDTIRDNFKSFLLALRENLESTLYACKGRNIIANEDIKGLSDLIFILIDGAYFKLGAYTDCDDAYNKVAQPYINHALSLLDFVDY